jgi:three-Cys-motif partner protein
MASDTLPTVWPASCHTLAKHRILASYLKAWMPILSRRFGGHARMPREVMFVDGFAGPGTYAGGEDGSPVIAIKAALEHSHSFPAPINLLFIEQDTDRFQHLLNVIEGLRPQVSGSPNICLLPPEHGDCDAQLRRRLDDNKAFGPALVFLDQFGYSCVAMDLIAAIMNNPNCEVFQYMNWNRLNPYMTDKTKWPCITRACGSETWKQCLTVGPDQRGDAFRQMYCSQLRSAGKSKFVWHFAMCGDGDQLLHWLFFCTNSLRGLEEMKKAMWSVDDSGTFRFSDADDPNQLSFFKSATPKWLADHLHKKYLGTASHTVAEVQEHVLTETPCYAYKTALADLEVGGRLRVVACAQGRKKGAFPDDGMKVEFVKGPAVQQSLFA